MPRSVLLPLLLLSILGSACSPGAPEPTPGKLTIFAAASLTEAFGEIGAAFEESHPGVSVTFNFAGSQQLRAQLEQGAQADVFASASPREMDKLAAQGFADPSKSEIFAQNRIVVVLAKGNAANITSLQGLARPGLRLVLAAEEVPAGEYARQVIDNLDKSVTSNGGTGYAQAVLANVVSSDESARQALSRVQLGEADAALVYASDAVSAPELPVLEIPAESNVIASYPAAPLATSKQRGLAEEFVAYLLTPKAQGILKNWGFAGKPQ